MLTVEATLTPSPHNTVFALCSFESRYAISANLLVCSALIGSPSTIAFIGQFASHEQPKRTEAFLWLPAAHANRTDNKMFASGLVKCYRSTFGYIKILFTFPAPPCNHLLCD